VNWDTFLRGENADFGALYRELEPDERERLEESIRATYDTFVQTVADGRDMSTDDVDQIARGQVWTGTQAQDHGLVDTLGGWAETIDTVAEILPGDRELVFKEFTGVENPFESMIGLGFLPMALQPLRAELLGESAVPAELQQLAELQRELERYGTERTLMLAPRDLAPRSE
jgi:protease-4